MSKPNYPDVMRYIINYAVNNLSIDETRLALPKKVTMLDVNDNFEEVCSLLSSKHICSDFWADELDLIELIMDLEDEFSVAIEDGEIGDNPTLEEITQAVMSGTPSDL